MQTEKLSSEPRPLPTGPFRVIVADPPWAFYKRYADFTHRCAAPYPQMELAEIKNLPVENIVCDDAILWLWVPNAHLPDAFEVITAWGFQYKTALTWGKNRIGVGDWLRGQRERCLFAVRGKPTVSLTNQSTLLKADIREHSRKPEEFYSLVEALCPGSKVELFARTQREGWVSHGDQATLFSESERLRRERMLGV